MDLPRTRWARVLLALLLVHVVWGLARVPFKVWAKRLGEIADHEHRGAVRFHLDNRHRKGADEVEFLLAETPTDAIVLFRGEWRGSFEFAAALLAPRLLVTERACPPDTRTFLDRPLATGRLDDGREGVLVLVGHGDDLELEIR